MSYPREAVQDVHVSDRVDTRAERLAHTHGPPARVATGRPHHGSRVAATRTASTSKSNAMDQGLAPRSLLFLARSVE